MIKAMCALEYAKMEYFATRDAINEIMYNVGVTSLAEVKMVIIKRPTVEDLKFLEQKAS